METKAHGSIHDDKATINKTARGQPMHNIQEGTSWISHKKSLQLHFTHTKQEGNCSFFGVSKVHTKLDKCRFTTVEGTQPKMFFLESNFYFVFNRSLYQYFFKQKNLKQNKDKNSTASCKSNYQLHKSNQQNYKAIKENKAGTCQ